MASNWRLGTPNLVSYKDTPELSGLLIWFSLDKKYLKWDFLAVNHSNTYIRQYLNVHYKSCIKIEAQYEVKNNNRRTKTYDAPWY